MPEQSTLVDQNQIKFNMAMTALLLIIGFLADSVIPVGIAILCQFAGAAGLRIAPYRLLYSRLVVPSGLVKPNKIPDHHTPHRFAALVGGLFNLIGVILLLAGFDVVGWVFIAIVFVLANLNLWLGFCAGCFMYYLFNKLGVPGFVVAPVGRK
jgi:hypothetical protein